MDTLRYRNIEKMLRAFIFYILFHTARCAIDFGYERDLDYRQELTNYDRQFKHQKYNQILSDLRSLFKEKAVENHDNSKSTDEYNDLNYINYNSDNKQEFDEMLTEVTSALDKIKEELIKFNNDGVLTVDLPVKKHEKRYKRDVTNITGLNATTAVNVTTNIKTTTEIPVTVTGKHEALSVKNESLKTEVLRVNNDTNLAVNSRRMIPMLPQAPQYVATTSRVKDKLLSYLEDTFNEVERKIKPLTNIKIALSNDDHYRIGYIIATIDTLEVNLKKLKNDMNLHQHVWDDEKILDLFDRIKATNTVASSLIESLKKYLPRN